MQVQIDLLSIIRCYIYFITWQYEACFRVTSFYRQQLRNQCTSPGMVVHSSTSQNTYAASTTMQPFESFSSILEPSSLSKFRPEYVKESLFSVVKIQIQESNSNLTVFNYIQYTGTNGFDNKYKPFFICKFNEYSVTSFVWKLFIKKVNSEYGP